MPETVAGGPAAGSAALTEESRRPSPMDDFLFDLQGFLVIRDAVPADVLDRLDAEFDAFPRDLPLGHWYRGSQRRDYNPHTGLELHNAVEIGGPFEDLIDCPGYLEYVRRFCGIGVGFAQALCMDECIASVRTSGGHHPVHSGGFRGGLRGKYLYQHGAFQCGQVNVLMAVSDVHEGDGPTMVIPGSHKANFPHPESAEYAYHLGRPMDTITAAVPAYLNRGDVLLFVDGLMHGGSARTNPGERRIVIYRYGPPWVRRYGYQYSPELLARLTPERRRILVPIPPHEFGDTSIPKDV